MYQRASSTLAHLKEVYEYCKRFGVTNKIYICPLNTWNEAFFGGGIMFSCLIDKKTKDMFAAGGRYDHLIKEHRLKTGGQAEERHAVGFSFNWEKLAKASPKTGGKAFLKKATEEEAQGIFTTKRVSDFSHPVRIARTLTLPQCDVLVASFDPTILRSTGIEILQSLWAHDISAELAQDARSPEELISKTKDDTHSWIVIVKQDILKIKTIGKKDVPDADIPHSQLLHWLRSEIRERDSRTIVKFRGNNASDQSSAGPGGSYAHGHYAEGSKGDLREQEVRVLTAQTKSKKTNRQTVVQQAQLSASRLVGSFLDGPIAAVELTGDDVLEKICVDTQLSNPESWRRVEQAVSNVEKKYIREIHDMLAQWRAEYEANGASRHAFVYNFRTGRCVYYDLGA